MAKFFSILGIITMVLSGGCSLWAFDSMDGQYVTFESILFIGGIPFAIGLIVYLLARRARGKNREQP